MVATVFDTLAYAKKLQAAGVMKESAEAQAEALAKIVCDRLATKDDISDVRGEIASIRKGMVILGEEVNDRIDSSLDRILNQLTVRLGSITMAGFILLAILIKLF